MADDDRLGRSLQESVLTLLCFDDTVAQGVSGFLDPKLFEEPYRDIAARAIEYRRRYNKAPGKAHIDDLFDHVLNDPNNRNSRTYQRILAGLIEQSDGLNAEYVANRVGEFARRQNLKATVLRAGQRYQEGGDDVADEVERILMGGIKLRLDSMDPGVVLTDKKRVLAALERTNDVWLTGIAELDRRTAGPSRKELHALMAPRGRGKSWWLIHMAVQVLLQASRVLHISLEMSEDVLLMRYMQHLFSIAKRDEEYLQTFFERESSELRRLEGFRLQKMRPKAAFDDPKIGRYIGKNIDAWGTRLQRILIKAFPNSSLTIPKLESYLDSVEAIKKFVPDVIMVDYPKLMYLDPRDIRNSLGRTIEELRRIAQERNCAMMIVHQGNRESETTKLVRGSQASEDISILATADVLLTYTRTIDEKILNLARLFAEKVRNDEDQFMALIVQNYKIGQFCMDSTPFASNYWDLLKAETGKEELDTADENGDRGGRLM